MGTVRIIGRLGPSYATLPLYTLALDQGAQQPVRLHLARSAPLDDLLGVDIPQTFSLRLEDDSMSAIGLYAGDILMADRSLQPGDGSLVVVVIEGDFCIRRLCLESGQQVLRAASEGYSPVTLAPGEAWRVRGVVTHSFRRP
ncbi:MULTISPECIES: LexA family protein [Pseudomonadaceae]|uniref:LexA family protein n=1 Tax=Pseudomonadaceae TaxID=135621 RepID=UPI00084B3508|nr:MULTISPECIES: S24 family peptidase [Pseudomonas]OEC55666.1 hypothetical protein A9G05_17415 [Pseudomonas sp. ENNP23]